MTTPMLNPLAGAQAVAANANTSAAPQSMATPQAVADRVDMLNQSGHAWMPADMQTTLAASNTSDSDLTTIADSIKNTLANTWNGFTEATDDNVLHKQPTTSLALARFLNSSIGPLPIRQDDLNTIQTNLQKAGYGQGLSTDGVWNGGWNSAYNQYASDLRAQQYSGDKPGSMSATHAVHSILGALAPTHVLDALVGAAKSLPGDVRNLAADSISAGVNLLAHPAEAGQLLSAIPAVVSESMNRDQSAAAQSAGATVASLGRQAGQLTPQQFEAQHGVGRLVENVGLLLNLVPIVGEGSAASRAAVAEFSRGVTADAAVRGPGVVAKSLFGGLKQAEITGAAAQGAGVVEQHGIADALKNTSERAALRSGLPNSAIFANMPLLRQISPVVGRLADSDGLYYQARTLLAKPYMYPAVRVAGRLGQDTMVGGAALRGVANAENATGAGNTESQDITNEHVMDTVNSNLERIDGTPFGHHFSIGLNDLALVLHGPLSGADTVSSRVGNQVQGLVDGMSNASGRIGIHGAFELATNKSLDELRQTFGSDEALDRFVASKTADLAASHYVQRSLNNQGLEFGTPEYRDQAGQLADQVWNDPALHAQAVKELLADPYEFKARIQADMLDSQLKSDGGLRNAANFMKAGGILSDDVIRAGLATHMFGGDGQTLIRSAQDAFDYGGHLPVPGDRALDLTRRDYTDTVNRLGGSVGEQLSAAQRSLADDVNNAQAALADAQNGLGTVDRTDDDAVTQANTSLSAARGRLREAQKRQKDFLSAVSNGDMNRVARLVDRSGSGASSYLKNQWQRLSKDHADLRNLVQPGLPAGQKFNALDFMSQPPDPDVLYDAINGPRRPIPAEIGSGDWMRDNLTTKPGSLGLGRLATKSAQQAAADVGRFRASLQTAKSPESLAAVTERIKDYLHQQFGMDARSLSLWDDNPDKLLDQIQERSRNLASDVFLTPDAPTEVRSAVQRMADLGYRPMLGSHIGHLWDSSLPPMAEVDGALTRRRRLINSLGLNPDQITSRAAGTDARIRMMSEMQRTIDEDSRVRLPARATAATVMAAANEVLEPELPWASNVAFNAARLLHRPGVTALMEQRGITDRAEALKQYKTEIARALQLRDVPRKQWMQVMTTPGEGVTANGGRWTWDGMDKQSAALLYRAVQRGYAKRGAAMMGWQAIEDWGRAGFGFLDKMAQQAPGQDWSQAIADLPNRYVQLRNRLRFDLSPFFDLRRISKTNYKMGLEGVTPTFNPLGRMVDDGTFDAAHATLRRVVGDTNTAAYDDADRYMHQQSVWGMYNSRHYEAYFAHQLQRGGSSDDEIRGAINRVFSYGSTKTGGRSALERTVNTIFFPFSFEKTLLRNTGAYLLDHPGQSLLLSAAVSSYRKANEHQAITNWADAHLPILRDMQKLNGFADGISPGQFGGINAPLLNLFLPQAWGQETTTANLKKFLPIWKDFGQLWQDTTAQAEIGKNAALNAVDYTTSLGAKRPALDPYRPTITPQAQQQKAYAMRNQAIVSLAPVLDYNAKQGSDADKVRWPNNPQLPGVVAGQVVNRTTIGYLVQKWYPAYNPQGSAQYAIAQAAKTDQWLAKIRQQDPAKARDYGVFVKLANTVIDRINAGDYDTQTSAAVMQEFRTVAANASETDPSFYSFYKSTYQWAFGPLEAIADQPR